MTSVDDIRELLAQLAVNTVETQTQINALAAEVRGLAVNVGAAPGAAPPVLALQSAVQTVRKSSETTVQLSLSDDQYTVAELGEAPHPGAAPPVDGITYIRMMGETSPAETETKVEALLDFHRRRGLKLRSAQRTLPDGAWVNPNPENVDDYRLPAPPPFAHLLTASSTSGSNRQYLRCQADSGINVGVTLTIWMSLKRLSPQLSRRRFSIILAMSVMSA